MNEEQRRQQHLIDEMRSNGMSFCRDIGIVFDANNEDDAIAQATEFVDRHSVVDADGNVSEDFIEQDPNIVEVHEIKKGE